nr:hypothetical protein [uncultured Tateyamaria sp.]
MTGRDGKWIIRLLPRRRIDQCDGQIPIPITLHLVLPDLFAKCVRRARRAGLADVLTFARLRMCSPNNAFDGGQIPRAFGQRRKTDVDVVTQHMQGAVKAAIAHLVRQVNIICSHLDLDAAGQFNTFGKDGRLTDSALGPKETTLP